jgi:hypothetical protein
VIKHLDDYLRIGFRHIAFSVSGDVIGFIRAAREERWHHTCRERYGQAEEPYS